MTDGEIIDNLMTFITAGHETTALGLAWTFDLLVAALSTSENGELFEEIDTVTQGQPLTADHVSRLFLHSAGKLGIHAALSTGNSIITSDSNSSNSG
ncbi:MAG: cytochrome P450 [Pseudomonas sp.]|nr:cytochrome P450 [Pseudomonas sp.]